MQNPHKRLLNHTRVTPVQQEPSWRPGKPLGTHKVWERSNLNLQLLQNVWSRRREFPRDSRIISS